MNGMLGNINQSLMAAPESPMFMSGLGLLAASRDGRINPFEAIQGGLLASGQYRQQKERQEQQKRFYDMQMRQQQAQEQAAQQIRDSIGQQDLLGAAQAAIGSGDPNLMAWGLRAVQPGGSEMPAAVREAQWYLQASPEERAAYDRQNARQAPAPYYGQPVLVGDRYMSWDPRGGRWIDATPAGGATPGFVPGMPGAQMPPGAAQIGTDVGVPTIPGQPAAPALLAKDDPEYQRRMAEAKAAGGLSAKSDAESTLANRERQMAAEMYKSGMQNLQSALSDTATGPLVGMMPAITPPQQTAEGAVAVMAPILKQLFRVSGEGTFTDRDQEILLDMLPKRTDAPEAASKKIEAINAVVSAKLGRPIDIGAADNQGQSSPPPPPIGNGIISATRKQ